MLGDLGPSQTKIPPPSPQNSSHPPHPGSPAPKAAASLQQQNRAPPGCPVLPVPKHLPNWGGGVCVRSCNTCWWPPPYTPVYTFIRGPPRHPPTHPLGTSVRMGGTWGHWGHAAPSWLVLTPPDTPRVGVGANGMDGKGGSRPPRKGLAPKSRHREWERAGTGLFWDNTKTRVLRICAHMYIAHIAPPVWGLLGWGGSGGSSCATPPLLLGDGGGCWGQRWVLGTHWGWIWPCGIRGGGSGGCTVGPDRRPRPPALPVLREGTEKTKRDEWKLKDTQGRPRRGWWHSTGSPAGLEGHDEPLNIRGQS